MRINHHRLRALVESVLLEGFKDDQDWVIKKAPELEDDIKRLKPVWIAWLISRFGDSGRNPKLPKENHPFEEALRSVIAFSKAFDRVATKWKSNETFRNDVQEAIPERAWNGRNIAPDIIPLLTSDEMELLMGLTERGKQTFRVNVSEEEMESDRVGKVGPWNLWMPTTKERSCRIAGYDPITLKPKTTWCTARMAGSNLFYSYVGRTGEDITLFYVIRDDPAGDEDWLSVGFVNGAPDLGGEEGGMSVDRANGGLTPNRLRSILGPHHDEIMAALTAKNRSLGGQHPARQKIKDAAQSPEALRYLVTGLSKDEAADLKKLVLDEPEVDPVVLRGLASDADSEVRSSVAERSNAPPKVLRTLASDTDKAVRRYVAENPSTPPEALHALAADSVSYVRSRVAKNLNAPPETLRKLASDTKSDVRSAAAWNPNTPPEVLLALASDADKGVRHAAARNPNTPPEVILLNRAADDDKSVKLSKLTIAANPRSSPGILRTLAADSDPEVRTKVARNRSTPPEALGALAADADKSVRYAVVANENTPPETFLSLASDNEIIRSEVARYSHVPPEILNTLASDTEWGVRISVAGNSSAPPEVLRALAADVNDYVSSVAQRTLKQLARAQNESRLRRLIRQML